MSRAHRNDPVDGWHHVMNHGIRDHPVFSSSWDRNLFLRCLVDAARQTDVVVVAFCLMGNHFHLVVHCPNGGLSSFMQRLSGRYARRFNKMHGYEGALFRTRFTSVAITNDNQLMAVTRYVHRNPLELGQRIGDHPWSSYPTYLGDQPRPWINSDVVLKLAGGVTEYRALVETPWPADEFAIADGIQSLAS